MGRNPRVLVLNIHQSTNGAMVYVMKIYEALASFKSFVLHFKLCRFKMLPVTTSFLLLLQFLAVVAKLFIRPAIVNTICALLFIGADYPED